MLFLCLISEVSIMYEIDVTITLTHILTADVFASAVLVLLELLLRRTQDDPRRRRDGRRLDPLDVNMLGGFNRQFRGVPTPVPNHIWSLKTCPLIYKMDCCTAGFVNRFCELPWLALADWRKAAGMVHHWNFTVHIVF